VFSKVRRERVKERYIYLLMDKEKINEPALDLLDTRVGMFSNDINIGILFLYIVINVFQ